MPKDCIWFGMNVHWKANLHLLYSSHCWISQCLKCTELHGHFLSTCPLPPSSYSWLEIHICWKVPMDAKIEPPIHAPNRRSAQPLALISFRRILDGIRTDRSRFKRSGNPCIKILPMSSCSAERSIYKSLLPKTVIQLETCRTVPRRNKNKKKEKLSNSCMRHCNSIIKICFRKRTLYEKVRSSCYPNFCTCMYCGWPILFTFFNYLSAVIIVLIFRARATLKRWNALLKHFLS